MRAIFALLLVLLPTLWLMQFSVAESASGRVLVASDATQAQAAVAPDGSIYVVYIRKGNIEVSVSTDGGMSFPVSHVAIDGKGRARGGRQRGPRIGVDGSGGLYVTAPLCFDEEEFSRKYPRSEIWYAHSADGAKNWSEPLRVNEVPKKASEGLHWLAVDGTGSAHVAWLDGRDGKQSLYYARVKDGKSGKNIRIAKTVCECCAPGLAVSAKGNPLAVVREGGMANRGTLFLRSKDGGDTWSRGVRLNQRASNVDG